jgi:hypothetical protein
VGISAKDRGWAFPRAPPRRPGADRPRSIFFASRTCPRPLSATAVETTHERAANWAQEVYEVCIELKVASL